MGRRRKVLPGDPKVAVAYLRASTDDQTLSPDAQRAGIIAWASRDGIVVAAWHFDDGISGTVHIDKRPELPKALADLTRYSAGIFVIAKRDRLARKVLIAELIEEEVKKAGAVLVSADGVANGSEPSDRFHRTVMNGASELEVEQIRMRTRAALAVKRARNERLGQTPFGKRSAPDGMHVTHAGARRCPTTCKGCLHLADDPHERACIAEALRLHTAGLSIRKIARGLWPRFKSRRGEPFAYAQIHRMLKGAGMLKATLEEIATQKSGATIASSRGGKTEATEAPKENVALQVEDASPKVHPVTGQRLVNRRLVKRADYLRHGAPVDLAWLRGQVRTLAGMKISPARIAAALVKTGVRRGDGADVNEIDVERWTAV